MKTYKNSDGIVTAYDVSNWHGMGELPDEGRWLLLYDRSYSRVRFLTGRVVRRPGRNFKGDPGLVYIGDYQPMPWIGNECCAWVYLDDLELKNEEAEDSNGKK